MPLTVSCRRFHFMNSVLTRPGIFSCAIDTFLEVFRSVVYPQIRSIETMGSPFTSTTINSISNFDNETSHDLPWSELDLYLIAILLQFWFNLMKAM